VPRSPSRQRLDDLCATLDTAQTPADLQQALTAAAREIAGGAIAAFFIPAHGRMSIANVAGAGVLAPGDMLVITPLFEQALSSRGRSVASDDPLAPGVPTPVRIWPVLALGRAAAVIAVAGGEPPAPEFEVVVGLLCRYGGLRLAQFSDTAVREDLLRERGAAIAALRRVADTDSLTGVANRDGLFAVLNSVISRGQRIGVVYVDLDGFKTVNDAYGHEVGDALLCAVAQRLRDAVRPTDLVARLAGDEFVLAVHDADAGGLDRVVRRVTSALDEPVVVGPHVVAASASLGTAIGEGPTTATQLLAEADMAMYSRKKVAPERPPTVINLDDHRR